MILNDCQTKGKIKKHVFKKISNSLKFNNQAVYCLPLHTYYVYRQPLQHLKEDYEVISILRSLLADNPPTPERLATPPGSTSPTLFETVVWVLLSYNNQMGESAVRRPMVFRPYPRRLESLTLCRCHNKGSIFFSVILRL